MIDQKLKFNLDFCKPIAFHRSLLKKMSVRAGLRWCQTQLGTYVETLCVLDEARVDYTPEQGPLISGA